MSILINKQKKQNFLLKSEIIPLLFLPTNGLFCKDATHISYMCIRTLGLKYIIYIVQSLSTSLKK